MSSIVSDITSIFANLGQSAVAPPAVTPPAPRVHTVALDSSVQADTPVPATTNAKWYAQAVAMREQAERNAAAVGSVPATVGVTNANVVNVEAARAKLAAARGETPPSADEKPFSLREHIAASTAVKREREAAGLPAPKANRIEPLTLTPEIVEQIYTGMYLANTVEDLYAAIAASFDQMRDLKTCQLLKLVMAQRVADEKGIVIADPDFAALAKTSKSK